MNRQRSFHPEQLPPTQMANAMNMMQDFMRNRHQSQYQHTQHPQHLAPFPYQQSQQQQQQQPELFRTDPDLVAEEIQAARHTQRYTQRTNPNDYSFVNARQRGELAQNFCDAIGLPANPLNSTPSTQVTQELQPDRQRFSSRRGRGRGRSRRQDTTSTLSRTRPAGRGRRSRRTPTVSNVNRHLSNEGTAPNVTMVTLKTCPIIHPGISDYRILTNKMFVNTSCYPYMARMAMNNSVTVNIKSNATLSDLKHQVLSSRPCYTGYDVDNWSVTIKEGQNAVPVTEEDCRTVGDWIAQNPNVSQCFIVLDNPMASNIASIRQNKA